MSLAADAAPVDVTLPRVGRCLRVYNAPEVLEALGRAMPGWPLRCEPAAGFSPELYVYRDGAGLWQSDPGTAEEFMLPSAASAACSLAADLLSLRLEQESELVGLHCGSVEIGGRLALFPQSSRAGKSTLATAFAAAGYRLFGDDVLGLSPEGRGVAMGVAPRLRLPLPASFSAEFADYTRRRAGPEDERYRFVVPADGGLARSGETCPLGALVLLERHDTPVSPEVLTLAPGEGLLQLLCQNFARADLFQQPLPEALMARFLSLMEQLPCLLLRYGEPLAGARYLARVLEGGEAGTPASPPSGSAAADSAGTVDRTVPWRPGAGVSVYPLGEELFLIHAPSGDIHRLNLTGRLVWQLLQHEALAIAELGALLADHFAAPADAVTDDVAGLIQALYGAGLVAPAG
ncbi:PqqD family peptide modification chaperone [Halomonas piscis]|uniref:PqqD family peptide modification chaperone n=1 Tax=Halomonas piscis TaxID=3031727 RepID=A0ABY9Z357_9GAMM|nr:PqqD family peptide modification chaperone [Halomonas piscis]WNK21125.1 PqqD family peptide modification chaperone [Halomonas piscis]